MFSNKLELNGLFSKIEPIVKTYFTFFELARKTILFDKYYPQLLPKLPAQQLDFTHPLQLLAKNLSFIDPVTGLEHQFESRRQLQSWPVPNGSKEN